MIKTEVPYLTTDQMREVDRAMIENYGIDLIQMMENAGNNLARLARIRFLARDARGKTILVLCGTGGNGGGGLVCARHLHNWGAEVSVLTTIPGDGYTGVPAHQLGILSRMGLSVSAATSARPLSPADLLIDAIIGYSLSGSPRGAAAELIRAANEHGAPILSLDAPSGIDTTTGNVHEPCVFAAATMTLALPKEGLLTRAAKKAVGELYLADIGVPPALYAGAELGFSVDAIFAQESIVRIA